MAASCGCLRPRLESGTARGAMQPTRQRVVFPDGCQLPRQEQESSLERILGILPVLQDPPADAVDHRSVAAHQGLESRLVAPAEQAFDKLSIGLIAKRFSRHLACDAAQERAQICRGYA